MKNLSIKLNKLFMNKVMGIHVYKAESKERSVK